VRVPCITIDGLTDPELVRVRTELRRALFSCWMFEHKLFVMSGQIDVVRRVATKYAFLHPRCRKTVVDGEELMQGRDETPEQYSDSPDKLKPTIAKVHGLERGMRQRLISAMKHAGFDAEFSEENEAVLIEYCIERKDELDVLLASVMANSDYRAVRGPSIKL
jgi:hypothetical protein